ncbi:MAG: [LysW]-lysine hydrolase [Anaerolineales bacterium]|nr:[LysW]-lysine hydrolase [Anaerolineales bacterium]
MSEFETLIGLVDHYSPSGQERGAVEWLVERLESLGFSGAFVDGAGNAIGVMGSGPKQVVLLGHIDTVPGEIPVSRDAIPPNEILYGRGSVDAKGPLACFVDAVTQVGALDGWQFVAIGAVDEERDSLGARFVVDKYKPDFVIIGEPNNWDRIALGYKGLAWANVIVKREQSHSASGEQTAAETAVEVWLAVKAYVDEFNADKKRAFDMLLLTLRGMDAGQDGFEQWARLNIGCRLPVEINPDAWYAHLEEIIRGADVERVGYPVPAWECEKNSPLVRTFLNGIRSQGGTPRFVYKTGTADLNVVAPIWKCPAVVYGPGDSALDHTPNEHISLEEYDRAVKVLASALRRLTLPKLPLDVSQPRA